MRGGKRADRHFLRKFETYYILQYIVITYVNHNITLLKEQIVHTRIGAVYSVARNLVNTYCEYKKS